MLQFQFEGINTIPYFWPVASWSVGCAHAYFHTVRMGPVASCHLIIVLPRRIDTAGQTRLIRTKQTFASVHAQKQTLVDTCTCHHVFKHAPTDALPEDCLVSQTEISGFASELWILLGLSGITKLALFQLGRLPRKPTMPVWTALEQVQFTTFWKTEPSCYQILTWTHKLFCMHDSD